MNTQSAPWLMQVRVLAPFHVHAWAAAMPALQHAALAAVCNPFQLWMRVRCWLIACMRSGVRGKTLTAHLITCWSHAVKWRNMPPAVHTHISTCSSTIIQITPARRCRIASRKKPPAPLCRPSPPFCFLSLSTSSLFSPLLLLLFQPPPFYHLFTPLLLKGITPGSCLLLLSAAPSSPSTPPFLLFLP